MGVYELVVRTDIRFQEASETSIFFMNNSSALSMAGWGKVAGLLAFRNKLF